MEPSLIITILIAFMQVFIVWIPLSGKLSDNRHTRKWHKRLTVKGWALISCCVIVAGLTIWLFNLSEKKADESEKKLNQQLAKRDSTHQKIVADAALKYIDKLDKSSLETAKALAQYGLKYDETKKEIIKFVSTDTIKPMLDPEVVIYNEKGIVLDTIIGNQYNFRVKLVNQLAPAKKVKLSLYFMAENDKRIEILDFIPLKPYAYGSDMNFESITTTRFYVRYTGNPINFHFYLTGTFENSKGKVFNVSRIYTYNISEKGFGYPTDSSYPIIINLLKRNNLYNDSLK